jgi:hypothetical protein
VRRSSYSCATANEEETDRRSGRVTTSDDR